MHESNARGKPQLTCILIIYVPLETSRSGIKSIHQHRHIRKKTDTLKFTSLFNLTFWKDECLNFSTEFTSGLMNDIPVNTQSLQLNICFCTSALTDSFLSCLIQPCGKLMHF